MKIKIYAIKDLAIGGFDMPHFAIARGQAKRQFNDQVNTPQENSNIYKHPEDYELYEIGEYETETAKFETREPELIERAKDIAIREKQQ